MVTPREYRAQRRLVVGLLLVVYRAGRDAALADLSHELRITVAVLEV